MRRADRVDVVVDNVSVTISREDHADGQRWRCRIRHLTDTNLPEIRTEEEEPWVAVFDALRIWERVGYTSREVAKIASDRALIALAV